MNKRSSSSLAKKLILVLAVVLIAVAGFAYYRNRNHNPSNLVNTKGAKTVKGTTSKPTPHNTAAPGGTTSGSQSGGVVDQNGQSSGALPDSSLWVSSNSGKITLQQPTPNTIVKSGDRLTGLAKDDSVRFILTDSSVGLIAQGDLKVVNGKFSGILQFTPHSHNGRLEVYHPNTANGAEEDIVEISVKFNVQ